MWCQISHVPLLPINSKGVSLTAWWTTPYVSYFVTNAIKRHFYALSITYCITSVWYILFCVENAAKSLWKAKYGIGKLLIIICNCYSTVIRIYYGKPHKSWWRSPRERCGVVYFCDKPNHVWLWLNYYYIYTTKNIFPTIIFLI